MSSGSARSMSKKAGSASRRRKTVHASRSHSRFQYCRSLQAIIDQTPTGNLAFLTTEFGKPFTSNGFGNWFRKRCDEEGLPNCSAHGLRKAGAALAAENGATERQLMAIFGWSTMKEASRYTKAARQRVLAGSGMKHLSREQR